MSELKFLLASASPRRRELLRLLNFPFDVTNTDVDETPRPGETAPELVARLSRLKAEAARAQFPDSVIIAADTDVELDGAILGKPRDQQDARSMLLALRGREHIVHGGVTIYIPTVARLDSSTTVPIERRDHDLTALPVAGTGSESREEAERTKRRIEWTGEVTIVVNTRVRMRNYSDAELSAYVATGDPLDKAAAYAVQHRLFRPVAQVEGCYANVMGLPLCRLRNALAETCSLPAPCLECHLHPGEDCTVARLVGAGMIAGS